MLPFAVDQVTSTCGTATPSRVTITLRPFGSASPTGPLCASPLLVGVLTMTAGDWLGPESPSAASRQRRHRRQRERPLSVPHDPHAAPSW